MGACTGSNRKKKAKPTPSIVINIPEKPSLLKKEKIEEKPLDQVLISKPEIKNSNNISSTDNSKNTKGSSSFQLFQKVFKSQEQLVQLSKFDSYLARPNKTIAHELIKNEISENKWLYENFDPSSIKQIGSGGFGYVFSAKSLKMGKERAIKFLKISPEYEMKQMINEIMIMIFLSNNNNIIKIDELFTDTLKRQVAFSMELGTGSLAQMIKNGGGKVDYPLLLQLIMDCLNGLEYAFDHNFAHMDIKSENILYFEGVNRQTFNDLQVDIVQNDKMIFKLSDWGGGLIKSDITREVSCYSYTRGYGAPEIMNDDLVAFNPGKADIFAFGMTILNCCGIPLKDFRHLSSFPDAKKFEKELDELLNSIDEEYDDIKMIIKKMLAYNSDERIGLKDLYKQIKMVIEKTIFNPKKQINIQLPIDSTVDKTKEKPKSSEKLEINNSIKSNQEDQTSNLETYPINKKINFIHEKLQLYYRSLLKKEDLVLLLNDSRLLILDKALEGNTFAEFIMGVMCEHGIGFQNDKNQALNYYLKAAEKNHSDAIVNAGILYFDCEGPEIFTYDDEKGIFHFKENKLENKKKGDLKKAFNNFDVAATLENSRGYYRLGNCYEFGIGCIKEEKKAVKNYKKAVKMGEFGAIHFLADCYLNGHGCPKDVKKALELYARLAEKKPEIFLFLGLTHTKAKNKTNEGFDPELGLYYLTRASEANVRHASRKLANCYRNGVGCPENKKKAFEIYKKEAETGDNYSQTALGFCYIAGIGCTRDEKMAFELGERSCFKDDIDFLRRNDELDFHSDPFGNRSMSPSSLPFLHHSRIVMNGSQMPDFGLNEDDFILNLIENQRRNEEQEQIEKAKFLSNL